MPTLNRFYALIINSKLPGGREAAMISITDGNPVAEKPVFMWGDKCPIRLYFRIPGDPGEDATPCELSADYSLVLAAAQEEGTTELFRVVDWVKVGADADIYYEGMLDLNTDALASAFATPSISSLDVAVDIEYRDAANTNRLTYRVSAVIYRQRFSDTGVVPSTLSAAYLRSPDGSTWQLTVNDAGQMAVIKVAEDMRDPGFVTLSSARFVSPNDYAWELTVDDEGQTNIRRLQ